MISIAGRTGGAGEAGGAGGVGGAEGHYLTHRMKCVLRGSEI